MIIITQIYSTLLGANLAILTLPFHYFGLRDELNKENKERSNTL